MKTGKTLRYLLLYSVAAICAGYMHEIGHALAGLCIGVVTVPTPAKEYALQSQLDWSKEIWIAVGGPIGTFAAVLTALLYFWRKPSLEKEAVLFGALLPVLIYSLRFLLVGRGHDETEWQAAQTAFGFPPASHVIDIFFLCLLLVALAAWVFLMRPSLSSFLRFPASALPGVLLLVGIQAGNNAVFDRMFSQVEILNVPRGLDPR